MKKECVPEGQEKGKGKRMGKGEGPMGSPYKEIKEITVDDIIDLAEAELEGAEEGEPNEMKNAPSQNPDEQMKRLEDDLTGNSIDLDEEPDDEDDYPDEYDEKGLVSQMPDESGEAIASEMVDATLLEQDSAYQTYFRGVMKKHGIKGIRGLSAEKRSVFFKDVSAGWRSRKKVKEEGKEILKSKEEITISEDYKEYFKSMMKKHDVKNITDLKGDEKKDFFKKVNAGWKSKEEMKEAIVYKEYKKYFAFMMNECGIEDFEALTETEQAEFYALVNEAFVIMNDQMQRPGAPISNPMSTYGNMIDKMKNQLRPERKARQIAAAKKK
jgi:hypothetical protein